MFDEGGAKHLRRSMGILLFGKIKDSDHLDRRSGRSEHGSECVRGLRRSMDMDEQDRCLGHSRQEADAGLERMDLSRWLRDAPFGEDTNQSSVSDMPDRQPDGGGISTAVPHGQNLARPPHGSEDRGHHLGPHHPADESPEPGLDQERVDSGAVIGDHQSPFGRSMAEGGRQILESDESDAVDEAAVEAGEQIGKRFDIGEYEDLVIGRGRECKLRIADDAASREHALLRRDWTGVTIRDLNSRNGLQVNNVKVTRNTEVSLKHGDRITIGQHILAFNDPFAASLDEKMGGVWGEVGDVDGMTLPPQPMPSSDLEEVPDQPTSGMWHAPERQANRPVTTGQPSSPHPSQAPQQKEEAVSQQKEVPSKVSEEEESPKEPEADEKAEKKETPQKKPKKKIKRPIYVNYIAWAIFALIFAGLVAVLVLIFLP